MKNYKQVKKTILKDKKIHSSYDDMGFEFSVIQMIVKQRIKDGITQAELARRIGTRQSAISRFEAGGSNPTLAFLRKVTIALDKKLKISL